ncbi:MAG: lasso peptide biosynthesis B2 protein [Gemmatimonadaceae bacterium]|nr:lasso peptide biosynthesis B2 protein [Gemmatimonadaceae bacterium]
MIRWLARKARAACDVGVALRAVARARRAVAHRPVGELVDSRNPGPELTADPLAARLGRQDRWIAERWGAAVDRALRWTPGDAACLVRASALRDLVARRGLPDAAVVIGVRRGPGGFEAHAWVEVAGTPIAEPTALRGAFVPLQGVTLR